MSERQSIHSLIRIYKECKTSHDRFIAKSLEELYLSGRYRTASVSTEFERGDPPRIAGALALVAIRGERLQGGLVTADSREDLARERAKKIDEFVEEEWFNRLQPIRELIEGSEIFHVNNLKRLVEQGLQTAAAVQLSRSVATGNDLTEIFYPKVFRPEVPMPGLTEAMKDEGAYALALYFLRRGKFASVRPAFEQ